MKVSIITPVTRPQNIPALGVSINDAIAGVNIDVDWILIYDYDGEQAWYEDAKFYSEAHTERSGPGQVCGYHQRNYALNRVEGFVYFLDDDNILYEDIFKVFLDNWQPDKLAYVYESVLKNGRNHTEVSADFSNVRVDAIDIGQVILHTDLIGKLRFRTDLYNADGYFLETLYKKNREAWLNTGGIVWYNYLRTEKMKKNLVILTTNVDESLDKQTRLWYGDTNRGYDLEIIEYEKQHPHIDRLGIDRHDFTENNQGKWKNIYALFQNGDLWDYDYYWFPDEDVEFNQQNEFFEYVNEMTLNGFSMNLCQPSLTEDSFCNWEFLYNQDGNFRAVDLVEVMAPCFSREALKQLLWTFTLTHSGYGIDKIWARYFQPYVIDHFQMRHARKQQFTERAKAKGWPDPQKELKMIEEKYLQ